MLHPAVGRVLLRGQALTAVADRAAELLEVVRFMDLVAGRSGGRAIRDVLVLVGERRVGERVIARMTGDATVHRVQFLDPELADLNGHAFRSLELVARGFALRVR